MLTQEKRSRDAKKAEATASSDVSLLSETVKEHQGLLQNQQRLDGEEELLTGLLQTRPVNWTAADGTLLTQIGRYLKQAVVAKSCIFSASVELTDAETEYAVNVMLFRTVKEHQGLLQNQLSLVGEEELLTGLLKTGPVGLLQTGPVNWTTAGPFSGLFGSGEYGSD
ncbi:hypothetical protein L1987_62565 [Smallanthus sonchifolius]|uniref:Uncharacterized protein n=1 Tax=Smallanthus sonchifolius TaxID=185202 RepID=A0ACB9CAT0_9ASTR|nr:hypothetical protein L1987_62565 [Smallanthus sonchifolius]